LLVPQYFPSSWPSAMATIYSKFGLIWASLELEEKYQKLVYEVAEKDRTMENKEQASLDKSLSKERQTNSSPATEQKTPNQFTNSNGPEQERSSLQTELLQIKALYEQGAKRLKQVEEERNKMCKEYQLLSDECNKLKYRLAQALLRQQSASSSSSENDKGQKQAIEQLERENQILKTEMQRLKEQLSACQTQQTPAQETVPVLKKQLEAIQDENEELKRFVESQKIEFHQQQQQLINQNKELTNKIKIIQQQQQMKEKTSELKNEGRTTANDSDPTVTFKVKHVVIFFAVLILYLYIR
jgi:hypothetical protein